MFKPKVLIFAPREEPPETINALEGMGCEVVVGNRDWQLPRTTHEDAVVEAARDAVALMGTSMRHTPISRRIMQASQRLRIVAKYTVGVDDIDTEAATDLGIMVCHAPTESNCFGVAETTITFMLSLLKKTAERDADVRAGKWRTAELRRQPHLGWICRPDHRSRRPWPDRYARRSVVGALARAHHRL
jgi:D-3-phosphoglycerate dehydrogenase / 2-oxoglutarate reductase